MSCGCNTNGCEDCPPKGYICIPRGDGRTVAISVHENDCEGDLFDISGATEIVFAVFDSFGGTLRIEKRLTDTDILISTNGYQFWFDISSADTASLTRVTNYFEVRITGSTGVPVTVLTGVFKSPDTMIRNIP